MPPAPRAETISYEPRRVPGRRAKLLPWIIRAGRPREPDYCLIRLPTPAVRSGGRIVRTGASSQRAQPGVARRSPRAVARYDGVHGAGVRGDGVTNDGQCPSEGAARWSRSATVDDPSANNRGRRSSPTSCACLRRRRPAGSIPTRAGADRQAWSQFARTVRTPKRN